MRTQPFQLKIPWCRQKFRHHPVSSCTRPPKFMPSPLHSSSPHMTWTTPPPFPLRQVAFQQGVTEPRVTVTLVSWPLAHVSGLSHHPFRTLVTLSPTQSCLAPSSGFPLLCGSSLPNRDDVCSFVRYIGVWTPDLTHARQVLDLRATPLSPFLKLFILRQGLAK